MRDAPPRESVTRTTVGSGKIAKGPNRKRYYGKSIAHYFPDGAQNPIKYVNC